MIWPLSIFKRREIAALPDFTGSSFRAMIGGLTRVDPRHYSGWSGACAGADVDLANLSHWAERVGCLTARLRDNALTHRNVQAVSRALAYTAPEPELIVIGFSGHGSQTTDRNGDEADGLDETLCLYDGQMTDDLLGAFFGRLSPHTHVLLITDCCTSGTAARSGPIPMAHQVYRASEMIGCQLYHVAGCEDGKVSWGGRNGGALTNAWIKAYRPGMTVEEIFAAMPQDLGKGQVPQLMKYSVSKDFENRRF